MRSIRPQWQLENEQAMKFFLSAAAILALMSASGCATITMTSATAPAAIEASSDLPDAARLDVSVIEFDPGLPADGKPMPDGLYPEIREAEAKLLSVQLKRTLEETQNWGTVSVVPVEPIAPEVMITATILRSDGRELRILVDVRDASGRTWFTRKYRTTAAEGSYGSADRTLDPHQPMFNTIANAMLESRSKLDAKQLEEIAAISELQFASRLSPEVFDGYLETDDDGDIEIVRLPARDEPMLERIEEVRLRDEMFVDTMGIHYQNFASRLESNYWYWRETSSQELYAKEALRREQIARGVGSVLTIAAIALTGAFASAPAAISAAIAGASIIQYQMQLISALSQQRQMHEEGLHELAQSFQAEVQPMVVELDSTTVRLTGTTAAQYEEWQRLLREVYNAENAMIADVYMVPRQPTEETWIGDNTLPMVRSRPDVELR
jgi:hypothetical protein